MAKSTRNPRELRVGQMERAIGFIMEERRAVLPDCEREELREYIELQETQTTDDGSMVVRNPERGAQTRYLRLALR